MMALPDGFSPASLLYLNPELQADCNVLTVEQATAFYLNNQDSTYAYTLSAVPKPFNASAYITTNRQDLAISSINASVRKAMLAEGLLPAKVDTCGDFLGTLAAPATYMGSGVFHANGSNASFSQGCNLSPGDRLLVQGGEFEVDLPVLAVTGSNQVTLAISNLHSVPWQVSGTYILYGIRVFDIERVGKVLYTRQASTTSNPTAFDSSFNASLYKLLYPETSTFDYQAAYVDYIVNRNSRAKNVDNILTDVGVQRQTVSLYDVAVDKAVTANMLSIGTTLTASNGGPVLMNNGLQVIQGSVGFCNDLTVAGPTTLSTAYIQTLATSSYAVSNLKVVNISASNCAVSDLQVLSGHASSFKVDGLQAVTSTLDTASVLVLNACNLQADTATLQLTAVTALNACNCELSNLRATTSTLDSAIITTFTASNTATSNLQASSGWVNTLNTSNLITFSASLDTAIIPTLTASNTATSNLQASSGWVNTLSTSNLLVAGTLSVNDELTCSSNCSILGALYVGGNLQAPSITAAASATSNLLCWNDASIAGIVKASNCLLSNLDAGTASVTSLQADTANIISCQAINFSACNVSLNGPVGISGPLTCSSNCSIMGALYVGGTFEAASFSAAASATSNLQCWNNASILGMLTSSNCHLSNLQATTSTLKTATIQTLTCSSNTSLQGAVLCSSNVTVLGSMTACNDMTVCGNLYVDNLIAPSSDTSDERLKKVGGQLDGKECIQLIKRMNLVKFKFDTGNKKMDANQRFGVLAQELEAIDSNLVYKRSWYVPDIDVHATVHNGLLHLSTPVPNLQMGDKVKLIADNREVLTTVVSTLSDTTIAVAEPPTVPECRLYGRLVQDLRNVDYRQLVMVCLGALQSLVM
eukprot:jgi/Chrzof1/12581/UNPLg00534.t1